MCWPHQSQAQHWYELHSLSLSKWNCRLCLWSPQLKLLSPYSTEVPSMYLLSLLDNSSRQSSEHLLFHRCINRKLTTLSTISFALLFFNWSTVDCYSVSGIHQSDSVIYMFSRFLFIMGYYKILNIAPCACLSYLYIVVYICWYQIPNLSLPWLPHHLFYIIFKTCTWKDKLIKLFITGSYFLGSPFILCL